MARIEFIGLETIPEIKPGDDLAKLIVDAANRECSGIKDNDIIVITSKVVSKAEGRIIELDEIKPSRRALELARKTGKDPREVQAILDETEEIIAVIPIKEFVEEGIWDLSKYTKDLEGSIQLINNDPCFFITLNVNNQIYTDAGLDFSNHPPGQGSLPPKDPDESARRIRESIRKLTGKDVAVIIADTEVFPAFGSIDLCRGCSGILPFTREFGELDRFGKPKYGGVDLVVHEVACASALLFGQTNRGIPVVIARGVEYEKSDKGLKDYVLDAEKIRKAARIFIKKNVKVLGALKIVKMLIGREKV
ncbi:F420-dependent oxidoreductase [archaeon]|nr:MAG: F420-dependent oxidoreductase [archaeon]RLG65406.1 MAG: F420-dependent oxidoreductase [archaeon]RLG66451.1 MAG: F420-dependent oxidoreductase [archaeon]